MNDDIKSKVEAVAAAFHAEYEALAKTLGYETKPESAVAWPDVPKTNKLLMMGVIGRLVGNGVIRFGPAVESKRGPQSGRGDHA